VNKVKELATATIEIEDTQYILAATEKGLAYFGVLENSYETLPKFFKGYSVSENPEMLTAYIQPIKDYFTNQNNQFTFPLDLVGTEFQKEVWQELLQVQYGTITNYSELAEKIGRPTAVRAVANAVGRNPLLIIVPCHRVLGKDGSLTGFRGGLPLKRKLLKIEGLDYSQVKR
jgi:methylated-DNA-[protein]-cysteine S-methyltransferase